MKVEFIVSCSLVVNTDPESVVYLPLGEGDSTQSGSSDKNANAVKTNGLNLLSKLGIDLGIDLGVSSVDQQSPASQESLLENLVFEPDDYTNKASRRSMYLNIGEDNCHLEITNILPPEYMPYSSASIKGINDEDECRRVYAREDRKIAQAESLSRDTPEYIQMRRDVMEDTEILYPSDHLSIQYTRMVYLNVSMRENYVVSELYSRISQSPCLSSSAEKYEEMTAKLTVDPELVWNTTKQALMKEMSINGQMGEPEDRVIEEVVRNDEYQNRKKRLSKYFSVQYYSSSKEFCDGCPHGTGRKNFKAIREYPKHYLIRKWVGEKEVDTIYTNDNGRRSDDNQWW